MGGKGTGTAASGYVGVTYPLLTTTGSTLQTVSTLKNYFGGFIYVSTADLTLTGDDWNFDRRADECGSARHADAGCESAARSEHGAD
jgi:hypothetical protein